MSIEVQDPTAAFRAVLVHHIRCMAKAYRQAAESAELEAARFEADDSFGALMQSVDTLKHADEACVASKRAADATADLRKVAPEGKMTDEQSKRYTDALTRALQERMAAAPTRRG